MLGATVGVEAGGRVRATGTVASVPVGEALLGRIVNPLGVPLDGGAELTAKSYEPVERQAPSIVDRDFVNRALHTGLVVIDAMLPLGRGQRELIIGDRGTGKTAVAIDTILNQKGGDVICIYCAIGQRAGKVASVVEQLREYGAMDYSIIVAANASDPAPLQYIAPYAAAALAEHFMWQGKHTLCVYDDLS
ncbi:MAG TPA: F0F1 ATP synthase subunit alpha, partial [Pseudolabrys sp.]|nr:F0F1 ATP synthase subunit alpha [Pseudolabrys sp.]